MRKYKIEIETLTPIHIGNGNTYGLLDFMIYEESEKCFLYRFDLNNLIRKLNGDLKNELLQIIEENDFIKLKDFFSENYENLEGKIKEVSKSKLQVSKYVFERWKEKLDLKLENMHGDSLEAKKNNLFNQLGSFQVSEFINQRGKYYIPGSSLKGAIRSAITNKDLEKNQAQDDIFKYFLVRDSEFIYQGIFLDEKWRLHNDINKALNKKQGDGNYFEFLNLGYVVETEIIIKKEYEIFNNLPFNIKKYTENKLKNYLKQLDGLINYYETDEEKQRDREIEAKIEKLNIVKENFEYIQGLFGDLKNNETILSIGFGGGYWFKTFLGNEKHPDKKLNKSRWQIPRTSWKTYIEEEDFGNWKNLGFIKLTFNDA